MKAVVPYRRKGPIKHWIDDAWRHRAKTLLFSFQEGKCFYCGCKLVPLSVKGGDNLPDNFPTLDHLLPRLGQQYRRDWRLSNLVVACFRCNYDKGNMNWTRFYMLKNPLPWSKTTQ